MLCSGACEDTGRASGSLGEGQLRVPAPALASQGFILCPSLYVEVGVIVLHHNPLVTFCHRDFLWLNPLGIKVLF